MELPIVMRITALGHPPIMVDPRHNAYKADGDGDLPDKPRLVLVETQVVGPETGPAFELPGSDLDALLWRIGLLAFPDSSAPWLPTGQRQRLRRWPNLTALDCDIEQVGMVAMLANAAFTPAELAEASGRPLGDARSVINAFSLMGLLVPETETNPVAADAPAAAPAPPGTVRAPGLLTRLRQKFRI